MTLKRKMISVFLVLVMAMNFFFWNTEMAAAATNWYWPFDGYTSQSAAYSKISSSYGYRGKGFNRMHYGVDIAEARGKNVYAVRSGRVITAYNSTAGSAGRYIVIDHMDGYYSTYMHLSAVYVDVGTNVTQNTIIGAVGGSANGSETAYGAHLHLRISYGAANNASSINPCPPGYTRIGASFNDGVGYPVGESTISYSINRSAATTVCSHTYWKGSETAHPHKEFYKCSKCGYYYYTGVNFAGQITSCSTCQAMSRKPAINVSVNGTTVNLSWNDVSVLHNYMYIRNLETGEIPFSKNMGKTLSQSVNLTPGKYRATVSAYYAAGEDSYTYSYVDFVVAGNTKPAVCNHSYTTEYEAAHPHKEYKRCTKCGYTEYTGKNRGVLYCGYETEHPHRAYRKCTICGYYYNEDEFQKVSNCVTCNSQKTFKITIDPTGGTIIKGKETYEFNGEGVLDFSQIGVRKKGYKLVGWQVYFKNVDKWYSTKNGFKTKIQMAEKGAEIYTFDPSSKIHPHSNGNWDGEVNISLVVYAVWEKDSSAENICSHNYKISYGVSHPHKEYKICLLCGDVQYTGKTSTSEDCKQCNPEEKKECQHTYEKRYEKLHPHEIYYQCSNCGEKYGTGQYTEYDDCDQCMEEKAKVTAVQITGKAYDGYIKLSWPGQTAISDYVIYRSTDGEYFEEYDETFENTYVDKNVKKGNAYYYYVIVQGEVNISDKSNICKIQLSSESKKEKICTSIENTRIKGLKAKKIGSKIKLTWDKSASKYKVDGYIVLRSTKKNTGYKQINTTTSKSCLTAKPKKGKTYYYMIYGYRIVDGKMINTVPAKVSIKG